MSNTYSHSLPPPTWMASQTIEWDRIQGDTTFLRAPTCFQADRSSSLPLTESAARACVYSRVKSTFTMQVKCSTTGRQQHHLLGMQTFWTQENFTCIYLSLHCNFSACVWLIKRNYDVLYFLYCSYCCCDQNSWPKQLKGGMICCVSSFQL